MLVKVTGKNFTINEKLETVIGKKLTKLDKFFTSETEAAVLCSEVKKGLCKMEATIYAGEFTFRAEESDNDIYYCLDKVIDKLSAQMSRLKKRLIKSHKDQKHIDFEQIPEPAEAAAAPEDGIVRTKRFKLHPMAAEEAILQMEMLGHSFFVFKDGESGSTNVVYKRADGTYGLLETEA